METFVLPTMRNLPMGISYCFAAANHEDKQQRACPWKLNRSQHDNQRCKTTRTNARKEVAQHHLRLVTSTP
eukprot:4809794-Amphidinium_carterae.2